MFDILKALNSSINSISASFRFNHLKFLKMNRKDLYDAFVVLLSHTSNNIPRKIFDTCIMCSGHFGLHLQSRLRTNISTKQCFIKNFLILRKITN